VLEVLGDEMRYVHYDRLTSVVRAAAIGVVEVAAFIFVLRRGEGDTYSVGSLKPSEC
jgi:hypothetical protein